MSGEPVFNKTQTARADTVRARAEQRRQRRIVQQERRLAGPVDAQLLNSASQSTRQQTINRDKRDRTAVAEQANRRAQP